MIFAFVFLLGVFFFYVFLFIAWVFCITDLNMRVRGRSSSYIRYVAFWWQINRAFDNYFKYVSREDFSTILLCMCNEVYYPATPINYAIVYLHIRRKLREKSMPKLKWFKTPKDIQF